MASLSLLPASSGNPRLLADASVKQGDSPQKIKDAAQQFEALLLGQVLSEAHEDGGWLGSGEDSAGSSAMGFAEQQLAAAIAHNGGLGLAHMIATGLERQTNLASGATAPSAAQPSRP